MVSVRDCIHSMDPFPNVDGEDADGGAAAAGGCLGDGSRGRGAGESAASD